MSGKKQKTDGAAPLATNRKAFRLYNVLEKFEAGIALQGSEVKSARARNVDLSAAYAKIEDGELFLYDMHIKPYEAGSAFNPEPRRKRRLLMHKHEIMRLFGQTRLKGKTLVPLTLFLNKNGKIKVVLALCQGKHLRDRRRELKHKALDRETREALSGRHFG